MREKVGKSRNTVFFQWFVAPEGWKVGSLKRRVRSQLARREMKNCTPLWRRAHFQVKMYKTHHGRTTFGSWDVEKVHAIVARSTFPSQNVQNTSASHHFWKLRRRKSARRCGANHISKSKCTKHTRSGPLLAVEMSKKLHAVVARSTVRSQHVRSTPRSDTFGGSDAVSRGRRKGLCYKNLWATDWGQNKRFFFLSFCPRPGYLFFILPWFFPNFGYPFFNFFKIIFLIIVFIMFFIRFLSFFILLAAKWIKIGFPRHKRPRAEEKCKILSLFCLFFTLLAAKWAKIGFSRYKRERAEEKCRILSFLNPFFIMF